MGKRTLVIVDMQNDFIDGTLRNDAAKAIVPGIVDLIKSDQFNRIICTLDTHEAEEKYLKTIEGHHLPVSHCIKMTNGWLIDADIQAALSKHDSVYYVEKSTFGSGELPGYIDYDTEEIVFVGTCTGICVINNVAIVKAEIPNADITVYEDLCACVTPESHNRAIEQMRFNHIEIRKWNEEKNGNE